MSSANFIVLARTYYNLLSYFLWSRQCAISPPFFLALIAGEKKTKKEVGKKKSINKILQEQIDGVEIALLFCFYPFLLII